MISISYFLFNFLNLFREDMLCEMRFFFPQKIEPKGEKSENGKIDSKGDKSENGVDYIYIYNHILIK